jgi:hypothetical protein
MIRDFCSPQALSLTAVWVSMWMAFSHLFLKGSLVLDGSSWLALGWLSAVLLLGVTLALWLATKVYVRFGGDDVAVPLVMVSAALGWFAGPGDETSGDRLVVAAVASLLAFSASRWDQGRGRRGGERLPLALVLVGALGLVGWRYAPSDWASWSLPQAEPDHDVLVIGLDGLDWALFQRYQEEGRIPALSALAERGVVGPMRTFQPTSSPFIWNSIYTGYTPAQHRRRPRSLPGPGRLLLERRGGEPLARALAALRPSELRAPQDMWSVLGAAGYSTAALGTWERGGPDTRNRASLTEMAEYAPEWPPGKRLIGSERSWAMWVQPELAVAISASDRSPSELSESLWTSVLGDGATRRLSTASYDLDASFASKRLARLRAITASDRMRTSLAVDVLEQCESPCFTFVYLRGLDVLQHSYAHLLRGEAPDPGEEGLEEVVARYHSYVDGLVSELLDAASADVVVWVVSDHGLDLGERPEGKRASSYKTGFHDFAPDGVWMTAGPSVDPAPDVGAHVLDVMPTLLSQLSLPMPADFEGRVIREVTEPGQTVDHWIDRRPTLYDRGAPSLSNDQLDDQLKALGYVDE